MKEPLRHIPIPYLAECFDMNELGDLFWRERPQAHFAGGASATYANNWNARFANTRAGRINSRGYYMVSLFYQGSQHKVLCHRIVWALTHGDWPSGVVDHRNRDRLDNRPDNLRDVPVDVNARNNGNPRGTGLFGAYRLKNSAKFKSQIMVNKKAVYLGMFDTAQEAHTAAVGAAACNGSPA